MKSIKPSTIGIVLLAVALMLLPHAVVSHAGTTAGLVGNVSITTVAPDCDCFVTPKTGRTIATGEPETPGRHYQVNENKVPGSGTVDLSVTFPSGLDGMTSRFDRSGNGNNIMLWITAACNTEPGTYNITVTGRRTNGSGTLSDTVPLTIVRGNGWGDDFKLSTTSVMEEIKQCETASFKIILSSNECSGRVDLVYTTDVPLANAEVSFSRNSLDDDNRTSTLTITPSSKTAVGDYKITITGNNDETGRTAKSIVTLSVIGGEGNLTLSARPTSQEIEAGARADYTITGEFSGCLSGPVELAVDWEKSTLPDGATWYFDPDASIDEESNEATLKMQMPKDAVPGSYRACIKRTDGPADEKGTYVDLVIKSKPQNFTLSADPTPQEIKAGDKAYFKVIGDFSEGFEGDVVLTATVSPSGPSGSFSPESISAKVRDSVLTVTTDSDTPADTYEITITGTHATLEPRTTTVTLKVKETSGFTLSADPTYHKIKAGDTATYTITVKNDDDGSLPSYTVNFPDPAAADGITATIEPSSLSPNSPTNQVTLTVKTDETVKEGLYTITVTAGGGGHTADVAVELEVVEPAEEFYLTVDSQTPSEIQPGGTATFKIHAHNFLDSVHFSVETSLPDGVEKAELDPTVLPAYSDHDWVTLTVQTNSTIIDGTHKITVRGVCGDQLDEVDATLTVGKPSAPAGLTVDKSVTPSSAKVGGILLYTIDIANTGRGTLKNIVIRDNMPAGVGYVKGSTVIDGKDAPDPSGGTTLIWTIDEIAGEDTLTLKYHGVVKPNIIRGKSTNTVTVTGDNPAGGTLMARASADIGVSAEDLERKGKIKGKVFIDENGNGLKNADEEGVAGVWVIMESGDRTRTDEEGMFAFDEVRSGEHLVGIDVRKLSKDYYVVGDYSKIVSVFAGGTGRTYFGLGRTGPSKEELEEMRKAEEEKTKKEEEARKEEEKKKEEEEKEKNAPTGTVFGNVFIDGNGNGIYNPGEKGVEKVTVLLDGDRSSVTDRVGNYRFEKVKEGRHALSIREDAKFKKTYRISKKERITVNVKANANRRQDIPVSDRNELKINIELTVR